MYNLIYLSAASYLFSNEELVSILSISRLNNARLNVTGLLLYNEGSILQILEGEEAVIQTLYHKISRDSRHKGIIKMIDQGIQERSFPDWSMGFKQISNEDWSELTGYLDIDNNAELKRISGTGKNYIITLIKSFANVNKLDSIISSLK